MSATPEPAQARADAIKARRQSLKRFRCPGCRCSVPLGHKVGSDECHEAAQERIESQRADDE